MHTHAISAGQSHWIPYHQRASPSSFCKGGTYSAVLAKKKSVFLVDENKQLQNYFQDQKKKKKKGKNLNHTGKGCMMMQLLQLHSKAVVYKWHTL